jgi:AraC-like DNA-binding protein
MKKYHLRVAWNLAEGSENIEVTPGLLAKSMFFYVQAVGRFYALPGYFTERENYNSFLLAYTHSGRGTLRYGGKSYSLSAGDAFVLDCKEYHYYECDSGVPWELSWVHYNGGASQSTFERIVTFGGPVRSLPAESEIPDVLGKVLALHRVRSVRTDVLSSKGIVDMLTELMLLDAPAGDAYMPGYVLEAINIIERNCAEKVTLDDLSAALNVSKFHLAREFKRFTGYSIGEYLTLQRLSLAKEMLKYTEASVEEIALQTGFNQSSHLIRCFKKEEEITPLAFRKRWRGK